MTALMTKENQQQLFVNSHSKTEMKEIDESLILFLFVKSSKIFPFKMLKRLLK